MLLEPRSVERCMVLVAASYSMTGCRRRPPAAPQGGGGCVGRARPARAAVYFGRRA